jgi:hypothetical protein
MSATVSTTPMTAEQSLKHGIGCPRLLSVRHLAEAVNGQPAVSPACYPPKAGARNSWGALARNSPWRSAARPASPRSTHLRSPDNISVRSIR